MPEDSSVTRHHWLNRSVWLAGHVKKEASVGLHPPQVERWGLSEQDQGDTGRTGQVQIGRKMGKTHKKKEREELSVSWKSTSSLSLYCSITRGWSRWAWASPNYKLYQKGRFEVCFYMWRWCLPSQWDWKIVSQERSLITESSGSHSTLEDFWDHQ